MEETASKSETEAETESESDSSTDTLKFEIEEEIPSEQRVANIERKPDREQSGGLLDWIRGLFSRSRSAPSRELDYDYLVNKLPTEYYYVDAVQKGGSTYLRSNLTGELYEPHEVHTLFDDLAAYDGHGAAEIDPFREQPQPTRRLE